MDNFNISEGFDWDDEVEESAAFEAVPDGDYTFVVTNFERGWFEPKRSDSKISACNQAEIEMTINWKNGLGQARTNKITYKLKLTRSLQWLIYQFFESIGLRKKGDGSTKMPWNDIVGKEGICRIGHHEGNGKTYNDIEECYSPENAPTVTMNDSDDSELSL